MTDRSGMNSRVLGVDVVDGNPSLNGAQGKSCGLVLLVLEDAHTAMLVLQRTVNFLKGQVNQSHAI